jgi:hypothetical protein
MNLENLIEQLEALRSKHGPYLSVVFSSENEVSYVSQAEVGFPKGGSQYDDLVVKLKA